MELYLGGYAQGKCAYVQESKREQNLHIIDGADCDFEKACGAVRKGERLVLNHLHLWIKRKLANGENIKELLDNILLAYPDCIILCDEIGNGVVPMEPKERRYREDTGRLLCELAKKAKRVERVLCGIGQRIK